MNRVPLASSTPDRLPALAVASLRTGRRCAAPATSAGPSTGDRPDLDGVVAVPRPYRG